MLSFFLNKLSFCIYISIVFFLFGLRLFPAFPSSLHALFNAVSLFQSSFFFPFLFQPPVKRIKLSHSFPSWELTSDFNPLAVEPCSRSWIRHDGSIIEPTAQSPRPHNDHLLPAFIDSVIQGSAKADVSMLTFPDPAILQLAACTLTSLPDPLLQVRRLPFQ